MSDAHLPDAGDVERPPAIGPVPKAPLLEGVNPATLPGVFRSALDRPRGTLVTWRCRSFGAPRVPSTRGVFLLEGTLVDCAEQIAGGLVLKVLAAGAAGALPREAALYRSGVLAALPGRLSAPRCHGTVSLPEGQVGLWLEYLQDADGSVWSVDRFGDVARHLGALAVPTVPELVAVARAAPRRDFCAQEDLAAACVAQLDAAGAHPLASRAYPPTVAAGLRRLWEARGPLRAALGRVPTLVCHGDAQRRNLFIRRDAAGSHSTVAIDWANFATAPAGMDAATLVHYALAYFDADITAAARLDQQVFAGYLAGLRAAGWRADERLIRLGYLAQLTLGVGLLEVGPVMRLALDERRRAWAEGWYGRPLEAILDRRAAIGEFLLDLGEEAQGLARRLEGGAGW